MRLVWWKSRPIDRQTIAAQQRIWLSRCGRYRVVRSRPFYGTPCERWWAMFRDQYGWTFILHRGRRSHDYRKRLTATRACEAHARGRDPNGLVAAAAGREVAAGPNGTAGRRRSCA